MKHLEAKQIKGTNYTLSTAAPVPYGEDQTIPQGKLGTVSVSFTAPGDVHLNIRWTAWEDKQHAGHVNLSLGRFAPISGSGVAKLREMAIRQLGLPVHTEQPTATATKQAATPAPAPQDISALIQAALAEQKVALMAQFSQPAPTAQQPVAPAVAPASQPVAPKVKRSTKQAAVPVPVPVSSDVPF